MKEPEPEENAMQHYGRIFREDFFNGFFVLGLIFLIIGLIKFGVWLVK